MRDDLETLARELVRLDNINTDNHIVDRWPDDDAVTIARRVLREMDGPSDDELYNGFGVEGGIPYKTDPESF